MSDFITLTCNSCGGKLQITPEIETFACMNCGTEYQVKRGEGIVLLTPIVDEIRKVSVSTDKTASELAIVRLKEEILKLRRESEKERHDLNEWKRNQESEIEIIRNRRQSSYTITAIVIIILALIIIINIVEMTRILNSFWTITLLIAFIAIPYYIIVSKNPFDIFKKNAERIKRNLIENRIENFKWEKNRLEDLIASKEAELEKYLNIVSK